MNIKIKYKKISNWNLLSINFLNPRLSRGLCLGIIPLKSSVQCFAGAVTMLSTIYRIPSRLKMLSMWSGKNRVREVLALQIRSRNSEKFPWPVAGWNWKPILSGSGLVSIALDIVYSFAGCGRSSPQDLPPPLPNPPPLMEYLKHTTVDTAWIKIVFGFNKRTNRHLEWVFLLASTSKFSNIGTLITAWLTLQKRLASPSCDWTDTILISHRRLELSCQRSASMNAIYLVIPILPNQGKEIAPFIWGKMTLSSSTTWSVFRELPQVIWESRL